MKIAIVHDWLTIYGGAERALEQILECYPDADLFSLIDFVPKDHRGFLKNKRVSTSFIQNLPFAEKHYRDYLPFMPLAVERFNLRGYDLVISSSYAVAKGVITAPDQLHICYLQARNLRYAYEDRGLYQGNKAIQFVQDYFLHNIRLWDSIASKRPEITIANSQYVRNWHLKRHGVDSKIIYPPVNTEIFGKYFSDDYDGYYVTTSRFEPYKQIHLIVEAFAKLGKRLIVIGDGSQEAMLKSVATDNVEFIGYQDAEIIARVTSRAKAFVFAAQEEFGIAPVEAQACGTPVIAFGKGGGLETIRGLESKRPTGVFFYEQTAEAIIDAVARFEKHQAEIDPVECRRNALRFSEEVFRHNFSNYVWDCWKNFSGAGRDQYLNALDRVDPDVA